MTTATAVLDIAKSKLGVGEEPDGSNINEFTRWYPMNGQPWCAQFVSWVMAHAGLSIIHFAYTPTGAALFRDGTYGEYLDKNADILPGDVVFYQGDYYRIHHVGIVEDVKDNGTFVTIEGNVSNKVMRMARGRQDVACFGRPSYDNVPTPQPVVVPNARPVPNMGGRVLELKRPMMSGSDVSALQSCLKKISGKPDKVDGVFGKATETAVLSFQKFFSKGVNGLKVDGEAGQKTKALLAFLYAIK